MYIVDPLTNKKGIFRKIERVGTQVVAAKSSNLQNINFFCHTKTHWFV